MKQKNVAVFYRSTFSCVINNELDLKLTFYLFNLKRAFPRKKLWGDRYKHN